MNKRRRVWRAAEQAPRHHREIDVCDRPPVPPSRLGVKLGDLLAMESTAIRPLLPDAGAHMQTEAFWREVWGVA